MRKFIEYAIALAILWFAAAWLFGPIKSSPPGERPAYLDPGKPIYIVSDTKQRPILRARDDLDRALKLARDGIGEQRPDLLREMIVCVVPVGTRVSRMASAGWLAERVMVAEGPSVGCEGFVWTEWLSNTRPEAVNLAPSKSP